MHKFRLNTKNSFWYLPTIYSVISIILVFSINFGDQWLLSNNKDVLPEILLTNKDIAKELYAALVTAILTMTTISFSVIMVVLTTYSTQFSPRALQDFMRSRMTQHVLGMYCLGFIFALIQLILVDKKKMVIGPIVMGLIAIIILAFFIYFIHHSARWIQVNTLIAKIRIDGSHVIDTVYKDETFGEYETWDEKEVSKIRKQPKQTIHAKHSGYVQKVKWDEIVNWAEKSNCIVQTHVQAGDFILQGVPIMDVIKSNPSNETNQLYRFLVIGHERTDLQDIEFSIEKLVEIALRAISPAINDPHTAINCINRIGVLLIEIGEKYKEIYYLTDKNKRLRVLSWPKRYEDFLYKSFYQIKHYAKGDVSVYYSLIEVLYKVALASNQPIKRKIRDFHTYIVNAIHWNELADFDYIHLKSMYDKLVDCCKNS